jgi:hypothetical protein
MAGHHRLRAEREAVQVWADHALFGEALRADRFRPPRLTNGECPKTTPEVRAAIAEMRQVGRSVAEISRVTQLSRQTVYSVLGSI